ncbi:hypothetical protein BC830DRAFT_1171370 [Chytriomyces sp. MP71]|nr:hypothetical protein BC830DRAFT_1171370 [Chytriomyces sp. MP71]
MSRIDDQGVDALLRDLDVALEPVSLTRVVEADQLTGDQQRAEPWLDVMPETVAEALATPNAVSGHLSMILPSVAHRLAEFTTVPWVRRFVVLAGRRLVIFATSAKVEFALDVLNLSSASSVLPKVDAVSGDPLVFEVRGERGANWLLCAKTKTAKDAWYKHIMEAIARAPPRLVLDPLTPTTPRNQETFDDYWEEYWGNRIDGNKIASSGRPGTMDAKPVARASHAHLSLDERGGAFSNERNAHRRKSEVEKQLRMLREELEFNQAVLLLQKEKIAFHMPAYEDASATYHAPHRVNRKYSSVSSNGTTLRDSGSPHSPRQSVRVSGDAHTAWAGMDLARTSSLSHSVAMHHGLTPARLSRGSPSPQHQQVTYQQTGADYASARGVFHAPPSPLSASSAMPVPIDMSRSKSAPAKKGSVFNLLRVKKSQPAGS